MPRGVSRKIGAEHSGWKGDAAKMSAGHARARRLYPYPLGPCGRCGGPGARRFHRDGNPLNNEPSNIEVLCRRCLNWKGDAAGKDAGHCRARKLYPLGPCEHCGKPATDRHHKDGNTRNNEPSNVEVLCRRCHMLADGRLEAFAKAAGGRFHEPLPPRPCSNCGRLYKPLRRGRCGACSDYFREHNRERTEEAVAWWHQSHGSTWNQATPPK